MKKSVFVFAFFLLSSSVFSQSHFYWGFGYNVGYARLDSLNFVVNRYNQTRQPPNANWVSFSPMKGINLPNGFSWSMGGSAGRFLIDISWVGRHRQVSAFGQPDTNSVVVQRDVKIRMNTFNVGLGAIVANGRHGNMAIGLSFDFGPVKVFTRVAEKTKIEGEKYSLVQNSLNMGTSVFMQFLIKPRENAHLALLIRPYYQFYFFKVDFFDTNHAINSGTYSNDPYYLRSRPSNFGVSMMLAFTGGASD